MITIRTIFALVGMSLVAVLRAENEADHRTHAALLIGNNAYESIPPLRNPIRDLKLVRQCLPEAIYEIKQVENAGLDDLRAAAQWLREAAKRNKFVFVYYAGHGVECDGENYLLPVGFNGKTRRDLQTSALALRELLGAIDGGGAVNLVVLDSCRDNPFTGGELEKAAGVGLADVPKKALPRRTVLSYSGAPGQSVPDGQGLNSLFCEQFVAKATGGLDVLSHFSMVADALDGQEPWMKFDGRAEELALISGFQLIPGQRIDKWVASGISRIRFGDGITLRGFLAEIKTYGKDGKAVFPYFLKTDNKLWMEPDPEFMTGDEEMLLDGLEILMPNGDLTKYNGKYVEVDARLSAGVDLYCHSVGLYVSSEKGIRIIDEEAGTGAGPVGFGEGLEAFVKRYLEVSSNNNRLAELEAMFSERVQHFGRTKTRAQVMEGEKAYHRQYPVRSMRLIAGLRQSAEGPDRHVLFYEMEFEAAGPDLERRTGRQKIRMRVRRNDDRWSIDSMEVAN